MGDGDVPHVVAQGDGGFDRVAGRRGDHTGQRVGRRPAHPADHGFLRRAADVHGRDRDLGDAVDVLLQAEVARGVDVELDRVLVPVVGAVRAADDVGVDHVGHEVEVGLVGGSGEGDRRRISGQAGVGRHGHARDAGPIAQVAVQGDGQRERGQVGLAGDTVRGQRPLGGDGCGRGQDRGDQGSDPQRGQDQASNTAHGTSPFLLLLTSSGGAPQSGRQRAMLHFQCTPRQQ